MENAAMIILILASLALTWRGFTSRMSGGGWPKTPWIWDRFLYALPDLLLWPWIGLWAALVWIAGGFLKRMGTAPFLDMGYDREPTDKTSIIVWALKPLKGKISDYWYDFIGNAVLGLFHASAGALALICFGWYVPAILLLLGGLARSGAYAIGWAIIPNFRNENLPAPISAATQIGEILSGVFHAAGALASISWMISHQI
jgi:hypothetical protein